MPSYATPADLMKRKDVRLLGDLAGDDGARVSAAALADDANLQAALDDASGEIDAALLQGKRYSTADLAGLTGNSKAYLARLTCDIAFGLLLDRRPEYIDRPAVYDQAMEARRKALERLRTGEHIFDAEAAKEAGVPKAGGISRVEKRRLNLISTQARGHFYPRQVLPDNR